MSLKRFLEQEAFLDLPNNKRSRMSSPSWTSSGRGSPRSSTPVSLGPSSPAESWSSYECDWTLKPFNAKAFLKSQDFSVPPPWPFSRPHHLANVAMVDVTKPPPGYSTKPAPFLDNNVLKDILKATTKKSSETEESQELTAWRKSLKAFNERHKVSKDFKLPSTKNDWTEEDKFHCKTCSIVIPVSLVNLHLNKHWTLKKMEQEEKAKKNKA